jgi:hypothetical protein
MRTPVLFRGGEKLAEESRLSKWNQDEVEEYRKKINRILKEQCGKDVLGAMLGMEFTEAPDLSGKPMVAILVPHYTGIKSDTQASLQALGKYTKQFCPVSFEPTVGSCVVHWTRNALIASLYRTKSKFTHACFIDADMIVPPDMIVRMLRHEKDIVGALCTRRNDPPIPNMRRFDPATGDYHNVYEWEPGLIEADAVGTGVMMISRKALDAVADYYVNCEYELSAWAPAIDKLEAMRVARRAHLNESGDAMWFQFLPALNGRGEYGEDISFCQKARAAGLKVFVDTDIQPGHIGDYRYSIPDFLPYRYSIMGKESKVNQEQKD